MQSVYRYYIHMLYLWTDRSFSDQNEPENSNPTYPTCLVSPEQEGEMGLELRSLMDVTGFGKTKVHSRVHVRLLQLMHTATR
jgi:hypothetical protein